MTITSPKSEYFTDNDQLVCRGFVAVFVGIAYYGSAKFGLTLSSELDGISLFWPPNSIVLTALLLNPSRYWWSFFLAMAPGYFYASHEIGQTFSREIIFFPANCIEILIPSLILKHFNYLPLKFNKIKEAGVFILVVVFIAPFISATIASFSVLIEEQSWWNRWHTWFQGDLLGFLVCVPLMISLTSSNLSNLKNRFKKNYFEIIGLGFFITMASLFAFGGEIGSPGNIPALVYLPLPFILWASVRFGNLGTFGTNFIVAIVSISNASLGRGPFSTFNSADNALSLQIFLLVLLISTMLLTAFIEEHKKTALDLEARQIILNLSQEALWKWHIKEGRLEWIGDIDASLGYPPNGFPRTIEAWENIIHSNDRERVTSNLKAHHEKGIKWDEEYRVIKNDGSVRWWNDRGVTQWDQNGKPLVMTGAIMDITEKKENQEELRKREESLKIIADLSYDVLWEWDIQGGYHKWIGDIDTALGFEKNKFPRTIEAWESIIHPSDRKRVINNLKAHHEKRIKWREEYRVIKVDGSIRWWDDRGETRWDKNGKPLVMTGAIMDITAKKENEKQLKLVLGELERHKEGLENIVEERTKELTASQQKLHHADKLSSLGKLVGSIAHEFNNPIFAIQLILEQLEEEIVNSPIQTRKGLSIAIKECERISHLIAKLKDFYVPSSGKLELVFLNKLLEDVLILLERTFAKNNIEIIKNIQSDLKTVLVVEDQIKQVLLNVLQNSVEAFKPNSKQRNIQIDISNTKLETKIGIKDNGSGIERKMLGQIFNPFVTTKENDKSSGLGLPISYRIIEDLGGKIEVASEKNVGTTFTITLPVETEQ